MSCHRVVLYFDYWDVQWALISRGICHKKSNPIKSQENRTGRAIYNLIFVTYSTWKYGSLRIRKYTASRWPGILPELTIASSSVLIVMRDSVSAKLVTWAGLKFRALCFYQKSVFMMKNHIDKKYAFTCLKKNYNCENLLFLKYYKIHDLIFVLDT